MGNFGQMGGIYQGIPGRDHQKHTVSTLDLRGRRLQANNRGVIEKFATKWGVDILEVESWRILCKFTSADRFFLKFIRKPLVLDLLNPSARFRVGSEEKIIHFATIFIE